MRTSVGAVRRLLAFSVMSTGVLLWGCSGIHLRSDSYDWVTGERTAPAAVSAAKTALAEVEKLGTVKIAPARYEVARAREYLSLAERELFERDLAAAEAAAEIAKKAAEEAKVIAQRGQ